MSELPSKKELDNGSGEIDRSSDFADDAGGVDAGDMYRMGKEQQFRVRCEENFEPAELC